LIARPFSTVTRIAQVSGQSCGHTARANSVGAFIAIDPGKLWWSGKAEFYYVNRTPT
jgi:hypothetical protein